MADKGWICVYRQIQDCVIWQDQDPFDRRSAWIDLLLLANHRDKEIIFNGEKLTIERGQYLTSVRSLADRWHWGKDRVLRYLRLLEELQMIERHSDRYKTLLTIENYGIYQDVRDTDKDTSKHTGKDTDKPQTTNKQLNNETNKEIRHKHGIYSNVLLTDTDMEKLQTEFPTDYQTRIDRLSEYMKSTGKSYKDHLVTIRSWARRDKEMPQSKKTNSFNEYPQNDYAAVIAAIEGRA